MSIIKKPTQKSAIETASLIGGGVGGAMLSRGAFALVHDDSTNPATGTNWTKIGKRVAGIVAGAGLAMFVKADDALSNAAKGAGVGIALAQGLDLITDISASNSKTAVLATSTSKTDKFLAKSLGLSCPGDVNFLARPRRRALRMPEFQVEETMVIPQVKTLDSIMAEAV
ncbi:MAG: hypothetical protein EOP00_13030 [Pedobacter sp.]|nr:MAG: hypothetical protein EOP00_13030 [Pedobacter sp.]